MYNNRDRLQGVWDSLRRRLVDIADAIPGADAFIVKQLLGDVYVYLSDCRSAVRQTHGFSLR